MAEQDRLFLSLSEIAERIRRKTVSSVEVTGAVLERLERLNPRLNACITVHGADLHDRVRLGLLVPATVYLKAQLNKARLGRISIRRCSSLCPLV